MLKRPFAQNINPSLAWKSFKTWDNIKQKWEAGNIMNIDIMTLLSIA